MVNLNKQTQHDFLTNYQDKKPYLFKNIAGIDWFDWLQINQIIERADIISDDFKIAHQGIVEKHHYVESFIEVGMLRHRLIKPAVYNLLQNGATVIANKIINEPAVDHFARQIAQMTNRQTVSSMYVAFGDKDSYKAHWDTRDVFAIQIKGRKRWVIYQPTFPNPLYMQQSKYYEDTHPCPKEPIMDIVLEAGDMLYIPCGWWHNPSPLGEETVHLAIGTFPAFGLDYTEWLSQKLPEILAIRKPLSNWQNDQENIQSLANNIANIIANKTNYDQFMQEFIANHRLPSKLNLELLGNNQVSKLPLSATLRLNSTQSYDDDSEYIITNGIKLNLDSDLKSVLIHIAKNPNISVDEILTVTNAIDTDKIAKTLYTLCANDVLEVVKY
ncbi:JmjC domain-containing protein [Moraxella cuniculi]|uniref:Cupin superfamily protein n=1 Tax=Moraxella cuniculi TaxID=34061 RepID=A0A448GVK7_9GAMM|nr:cupin domain-containing protein [Moraxella cuniculi]VEG12775.1 Cupin superfamily protein [Moraxella cuniculi]